MHQNTYFILKHVSPHTCGLFFLEEVNGLSSPYTIVNTVQFQDNMTKGLAWVRFAETKFSIMHWGGLFHSKRTYNILGLELRGSWFNMQCAPSFSLSHCCFTKHNHIQNTMNTGLVSWSKCTTISNMKLVPLDKWFLDCSSYGQNVMGGRPTVPDTDDLL